MLLAFAKWVMQGRYQAIGVALAATLVPWFFWLGAAVVALCVLRKGTTQAAPVLIAALIPSLFWWTQGDVLPVSCIVLVALMAGVLRARTRWSETLIAGSLVSAVLGQSGIFVPPDAGLLIEQLRQSSGEIDALLTSYAQQGISIDQLASLLIGVVTGLMMLLASVACLALARSWQAGLYNPGGFRSEFHQLRLRPAELGVVIAIALVGGLLGAPAALLVAWVPLLVSGIALVHGLLGIKGMNGLWLVGFYALLLTTWPAIVIVLLLALIDSFANFRGRLAGSQR
ncbi:hypothetical protein [Halotalea alkalilenta]|uniref:DUF2232 domain-containing protein n=1 Tax=Halotalea alkalilenta TaxID=376489 RepID=A0A172YHI0_9GAMM|nr:hypothetical protein [Halotalea alkalilenta]ANF58576.1 hypothetical protein A5892_14755 [Halotalea alkalilenta]